MGWSVYAILIYGTVQLSTLKYISHNKNIKNTSESYYVHRLDTFFEEYLVRSWQGISYIMAFDWNRQIIDTYNFQERIQEKLKYLVKIRDYSKTIIPENYPLPSISHLPETFY